MAGFGLPIMAGFGGSYSSLGIYIIIYRLGCVYTKTEDRHARQQTRYVLIDHISLV